MTTTLVLHQQSKSKPKRKWIIYNNNNNNMTTNINHNGFRRIYLLILLLFNFLFHGIDSWCISTTPTRSSRDTTCHRSAAATTTTVITTKSWRSNTQIYQRQRRREQDYDEYYDSYYDDDEEEEEADVGDDDDEEDPYWISSTSNGRSRKEQQQQEQGDREDQQQQEQQEQQRGGMYKVYFDDEVDPIETQLDWEVCSDENSSAEALVLLPPAVVERPTAILHFVGGTFFGSAPKLWYRSLLEGLVRNTQCAIIVTPIPVTLLKSPLKHIELCQKLQRSFQYAWDVVLEDEYGDDLMDVPLCGIGHSLGARLLTVQATLTQNKPPPSSSQQQPKQKRNRYGGTIPIPPYKSFVLISFTNFGASAGIPGVSALLRQSRKNEWKKQVRGERERQKTAKRARQDWWTDDGYNDDDDFYNDDDWDTLVEELQDVVQEQTARFKKALTPNARDLEFHPTPDQLWKALKDDRRYTIPETLLVQFDDDQIDQSSKLATILKETQCTDIKFTRLKGNHLSPVSVNEGDNPGGGLGGNGGGLGGNGGGWFEVSTKVTNTIWKVIRGRSKTKVQEATMRDVKQSIARFITDVVTK